MKKLFLSFVSALFLVNFFPAAAEQPANFSSPYAQSRPAYSQRIHWLDHYDTATSQARQTSQPILILFTGTNWCPACIKLEKQVLSNSRFAQALADRLIFLKQSFPVIPLNQWKPLCFILCLTAIRSARFLQWLS